MEEQLHKFKQKDIQRAKENAHHEYMEIDTDDADRAVKKISDRDVKKPYQHCKMQDVNDNIFIVAPISLSRMRVQSLPLQ